LVNDLTTTLSPTTDPVTVANRLRPVLLKLNRHLRREIHSLGVTGGQASLLFTIQRRPGIGVRELAALERMSAPGMSKYVGRLEAAGLVTRDPSEADRRRVGLRVTPEAERVLRSVRSRRTAWLAARLRGLTDAELAAVDAAIEPLQELIDE
jgi:DNA-binding MarR family transcriptional regulator